MRVSGTHSLKASRAAVWAAIDDVAALRHSVPDCDYLERVGPGQYRGRAKVGMAIFKGTYDGTVYITYKQAGSTIHISVEADGGHARITGEGDITLTDSEDGTRVDYEGDGRVFGPISAVAQRLLPTASKGQIKEFFNRLDSYLLGTTTDAPNTVETVRKELA